MANYIQYGDKKLTMGEMTLDEAKNVMKRHFPELANMKVETKKEGDDTVHIVSKQAGTKGNDLTAVATSLTSVQPAPHFTAKGDRKIMRLIAGEDVALADDQIEAITDSLLTEASNVERVAARIGRVPSAYPASEVVLL